MLKREVFMNAMQAGRYRDLAWIVSAFSLTAPVKPTGHLKPWTLYADATGHYVIDDGVFTRIDDGVVGQPLFSFQEELEITGEDCPNVWMTKDLSSTQPKLATCYGNLLFNWVVMVYAFGAKLPYQSGKISNSKIEALILKNFQDDPDPNKTEYEPTTKTPGDPVYVSEYLKFAEAMYFLTGLTQLCVWAATKKTLLPPPGINEYRAQMLKENEGHLHELATIAKIDKALVEYDAEWLKGDPGGDNFVTPGKARDVVRKKKFLMHGAEVGLTESTIHGVLVSNSLHDGWDVSKFADMNNSLRSGSFNRGAQTMLGGVSVKWLLRASSNTNVTVDDCGSKLGSPVLLNQGNFQKYLGFTLIDEHGLQEHVRDADAMGKYLGKVSYVRNPMYCKLPFTDYCKRCVGDRLSVNPTGLSIAVSDYGSAFLGIFMKAMHGKQLKTAEMDLNTAIV